MTYDDLPPSTRDIALDEFASAFEHYLDRENNLGYETKDDVLNRVAERIKVDKTFHTRQFDRFLKELYANRYLQITSRTLVEEAEKLREKFSKLKGVTVVSSSSQRAFSHIAAKEFIKEIGRIGDGKPDKRNTISIGIMSGTTTERVVSAAKDLSPWEDLGVDPKNLPPIKFFPLNVSFTDPAFLSGNATILNFILANTINDQGGKAEAYGINAPLTVEKSRLREVDLVSQTKEVLNITNPSRVAVSSSNRIKGQSNSESEDDQVDTLAVDDATTELDLILTGVGEKPAGDTKRTESGSIFYKLAKENGINLTQLDEQRVVGDVAFIPLRSDGTPAELKNSEGEEVAFYSTISLNILRAMAGDRNKSVILCAQSSVRKNKVPVLFASIGGPPTDLRPYASHLIVDGPTAKELIRF